MGGSPPTHLLDLGHRDIVFAGPSFSDVGVVHQRYEGFRAAFADRGLPWDDGLIATVNTTHASGRALGARLRADFPTATAVFATADILAIGVMAGLAETGASVPADVSVVGFDDLDISAIVTPKLTTVAQDIPTKAAIAVDVLLGAIERQDRPTAPITLDVRLATRDSTGVRPC